MHFIPDPFARQLIYRTLYRVIRRLESILLWMELTLMCCRPCQFVIQIGRMCSSALPLARQTLVGPSHWRTERIELLYQFQYVSIIHHEHVIAMTLQFPASSSELNIIIGPRGSQQQTLIMKNTLQCH